MKDTQWIELLFDIEYDYSPGRPAIWYPIDKATPEDPAELILTSVKKNGVELIEALSDEEIESIEQTLIDEIIASYEDERY